MARVNRGHIPGPDKLALLADKENVNLSWLLAGKGEPWIGEAPHRVREAAAFYQALTPAKRALLDELSGVDDSVLTAAIALLKASKRG